MPLYCLFSITDGFEWLWMGRLHKNIQLILDFLKAPLLVLHLSYYTLVTFLMMLSVILLSILMILLSTLRVIRHLTCCNNNCFLNLNLVCETLWSGVGSGLLSFSAGKPTLFCLTLVLFMWKWVGVFFWKNHLLKSWVWPSHLNWIGAFTLSLLLKPPPRKFEPWFLLGRFFLHSLPCIFIHLPYELAWNTVVFFGLMHLAAGWKFKINYRNGYIGLLFPSLAASP